MIKITVFIRNFITPFVFSFFFVSFIVHSRSIAILFSSLVILRHLFALNLPKTFCFYYSFPDKIISCPITSFLRNFKIYFVFWRIRTFVLVLMKSTWPGTRNAGLSHPGKVLESPRFFLLSWKVLENIWEVSCASPGQNGKATFFNNKHKKLGTWKSEF